MYVCTPNVNLEPPYSSIITRARTGGEDPLFPTARVLSPIREERSEARHRDSLFKGPLAFEPPTARAQYVSC